MYYIQILLAIEGSLLQGYRVGSLNLLHQLLKYLLQQMNLNNSNLVGDNTDKTFGDQQFERTKVKENTDTYNTSVPTISCVLSMIYHWNMYERNKILLFRENRSNWVSAAWQYDYWGIVHHFMPIHDQSKLKLIFFCLLIPFHSCWILPL